MEAFDLLMLGYAVNKLKQRRASHTGGIGHRRQEIKLEKQSDKKSLSLASASPMRRSFSAKIIIMKTSRPFYIFLIARHSDMKWI